ncbi:uncharacterized protein LY79DRAFT_4408 [Colletotrichum navitas]|uniref:Uncharacterized protein n=1 Tax=Colletotrichum navitas TaxID=681940 RepID=A0AAD8VA50_9PEZI|nr:uncharacterized protein LY79DRAFT_4408 [Colletotrichum navitas]KAK1600032.1 hypothetical protein LY79DRAFT_4408 [Colletotrichum navitas]
MVFRYVCGMRHAACVDEYCCVTRRIMRSSEEDGRRLSDRKRGGGGVSGCFQAAYVVEADTAEQGMQGEASRVDPSRVELSRREKIQQPSMGVEEKSIGETTMSWKSGGGGGGGGGGSGGGRGEKNRRRGEQRQKKEGWAGRLGFVFRRRPKGRNLGEHQTPADTNQAPLLWSQAR